MSLHYEWTLSLRLRPDVPEAFIGELRYHLGLDDHVPAEATLDYPEPLSPPEVATNWPAVRSPASCASSTEANL